MDSSIQIRQADLDSPEESGHIINLLNHYAKDIMGGGQELSDYVKQNLIPALKKINSSVILLAYCSDLPVALAIAFQGFSTFYARPLINIHDFVVVDSYRGRGIAKLMLEKIEQVALSRGCCKLTLEVLEGNKRAQKVYKSFGFEGYELNPNMGKAIFLDKKLL